MTRAACLLEAAAATDPGCVRLNNEDSFFCDAEAGIFIVADGMGGHNSGEIASSLAMGLLRDFLVQKRRTETSRRSIGIRDLEEAIKAANSLVHEKGLAFPKDAGMGTTVVCVVVNGQSLLVAHVGDSRLYNFRNGKLSLLTEDHSVVQDQVRRGLITNEEAARSNLQNLLTRAVGADPEVQVDVSEHPLLSGDMILLASDGLTRVLSDSELEAILSEPGELQSAVSRLIARAKEAGGPDNITVILARFSEKRREFLKSVAKIFKN